MTSLRDTDRLFRLHTVIYQKSDLIDALLELSLGDRDIVISNSFIIDRVDDFKGALVIDQDTYGKGEPKDTWVNEILKKTNGYDADRVIAIGGGATIDIAKFCIFADGRDIDGLFEDKDKLVKKRELVVMPTTCGTGSEVTSVAVIERSKLGSKQGLQIDQMFPDKAILVSGLLKTLPYRSFAITSIDALSHAIESLLSPKANPYTDMYAKKAIDIIVENLKSSASNHILPDDLNASLVGANMAGIAFSIAGCATMHALSFPIGAKYHLVHGEAVYSVMAETLNYYREKGQNLHKLSNALKDHFETRPIDSLIELLEKVLDRPNFKNLGMTKEECTEMGISVYENQQRLLVNSPVVLNSNDLAIIYENCLKKGGE